MKARPKRQDKTLLIDPGSLLLFAIFLAVVICLATVFSPGGGSTDVFISRSCFSEPPKDARAFLFFKKADINDIGLEGLVLIPGIGQISAQKILDFRNDFGFVLDLEELFWPQGPVKLSVMATIKAYLMV